MHGWWIAVGVLAAACLAPVPRHCRRRAERVRIGRIRAAIDLSLSAQTLPHFSGTSAPGLNLKQPDDTSPSNPPTEGSLLSPTEDCVVRPRRRVVLGGPDLSTTLPSRWRLS